MGRALDVKFISDVDKLKHRIFEEYGLVGTSSIFVELSYWFCHAESSATSEILTPVQISNNEDYKIFNLGRKVDKSVNVFVTFREEVDGKMIFLRHKRVGTTFADVIGGVEVDTGNEVDDHETDLLDDDEIMMHVEEIIVVYASKAFGLSEVDGTTSEVSKKIDSTKDSELEEGDEDDYDYDFWNDFVLRNCEYDDEKDKDGGTGVGQSGGRTTKTNGGVCGEVASKTPSRSCDQFSSKGSNSSANKQRSESYRLWCDW